MHVIIGKAEGGVTSEQTKQEELGGSIVDTAVETCSTHWSNLEAHSEWL